MMKETKLLAKLELYNLYGINTFRFTKDPNAKRRYLLLLFAWCILLVMAISYVVGQTYGLIWLGMSDVVPAYLVMLASILVVIFDIFKAGNMIFAKKGYDVITSMPLRTQSIVMGRFLAMYVEDLLVTFLIVVPGMVVYGVMERPVVGFYLVMLVAGIFVPMLPLVFATLFGTLLLAVSARSRNKTLVQTLLMILFVVGSLLASINIGQFVEGASQDMIAAVATNISDLIAQMYPPAMWVNEAAVQGKMGGLFIFLGVCIVAGMVMIGIVTRFFHSISRRLALTTATHDYELGELKSSSVLFTLFRREFKRYMASSIYVMNTIIGAIMGLIMTIAICVVGVDKVLLVLELPIDICGMIPYVVAGVFSMMTTTSVAISMEGKQVWIMKTLPISTKIVLDSKILLNLCLLVPFYLVAEVLLFVAMKPSGLDILWLLCIPTMLILFAVVFGITVNLHLYSFDWDKEEYVVKQSASALIGGFAGMILALVLGGIIIVIPLVLRDVVQGAIFAMLVGVTMLLYQKNNKIELQKL